jgi:hypothetical protein
VALDLGTAITRLCVAPRLAPISRPSAVWRALLHGMIERLVGELRLAVARAPNPLEAVVEGAHRLGAGTLRNAEWH